MKIHHETQITLNMESHHCFVPQSDRIITSSSSSLLDTVITLFVLSTLPRRGVLDRALGLIGREGDDIDNVDIARNSFDADGGEKPDSESEESTDLTSMSHSAGLKLSESNRSYVLRE
jgi:hypothetical protein